MSDAQRKACDPRGEYSREHTFLHGHHLRLIQDSAISPEVSRERGYRTVTTKIALARYGFADHQCRVPALLIPVYDVSGQLASYQIRPDEPRIAGDGEVVEYERCGTPHLVIDAPPRCGERVRDPGTPLYLTDGVRKADSAASKGLCCIALLGLFASRGKSDCADHIAVLDWEGIALEKRLVRIVYDSDVTATPRVPAAWVRVRQFLQSRDARVQVIALTQGPKMTLGARVGLDAFFAAEGTVEELELLAQDEPCEPVTVDGLLLECALEQAERPAESTAAQHLRPDGVLGYAVPLADKLALVASDGSITLAGGIERAATRTTFSPEGIRRFRLQQHRDLADVLDEVRRLLVAHIRFGDDWQPWLVSLWVMGTFLHVLFAFFGYLHITSASKRCGKSLLLELLSYLCFNATRTATDPSPAFVFRDAERNCGTQLLDEVETLTDADRKSRAALMAMLNAGFKRGASVPRVIDAKRDSVREFSVYAPRVLASISRLSATVADRSFRIELIRKRRDERLMRFSHRAQAKALAWLRDELHLVALDHAREIAAWYDRAEELPIPDGVDDRLRDILEPLFAIAAAADAQRGSGLYVGAMVKAAEALSGIRFDHDSDEAALVAALTALQDICEPNNRIAISAGSALTLFQKTDGLSWIDTNDKARSLLRRLGFHSGTHRRERFVDKDRPQLVKETARGYEIKLEAVRDLLSRYCTPVEPSRASQSNGHNESVHFNPPVTAVEEGENAEEIQPTKEP